MSTGEKKPATTPTSTSPTSANTPPSKQPVLSRRTFLKAAVGASIVMAAAPLVGSGQILSPLVPGAKGRQLIANATDFENDYYANIKGKVDSAGIPLQKKEFFYWPYDISVSPYYKNILVRLDDQLLDPSIQGPTPNLAHYEAWNLTCVHLRCIVNPGYDPATEQYRLQCPCHGSQYRYTESPRAGYPASESGCVVPVAGPAFDLGLRPLPRIILSLDSSNNIYAERFDGEPGIGRTD